MALRLRIVSEHKPRAHLHEADGLGEGGVEPRGVRPEGLPKPGLGLPEVVGALAGPAPGKVPLRKRGRRVAG